MTPLAIDFWERALDSLRVARHILAVSPDVAASRAYYAAFYAVSAHFALAGRTFRKHSAVESAVHRDLVKAGLWPTDLGSAFSTLVELRTLGDYGELKHVTPTEAQDSVEAAADILRAVRQTNSGVFPEVE